MDNAPLHANCCICEALVLKKNYSTNLRTPKWQYLNELLCDTLTDFHLDSDNRVCNNCLGILKSLDKAVKTVATRNSIISELKLVHERASAGLGAVCLFSSSATFNTQEKETPCG